MSTNLDDNAPRHPLVKRAVAMLTARHASLMAILNEAEALGVVVDTSRQRIEACALQRALGAFADMEEATDTAHIPEVLKFHARRLENEETMHMTKQLLLLLKAPNPTEEPEKCFQFLETLEEEAIEKRVNVEVRAIISIVLEGGEFWEHR